MCLCHYMLQMSDLQFALSFRFCQDLIRLDAVGSTEYKALGLTQLGRSVPAAEELDYYNYFWYMYKIPVSCCFI